MDVDRPLHIECSWADHVVRRWCHLDDPGSLARDRGQIAVRPGVRLGKRDKRRSSQNGNDRYEQSPHFVSLADVDWQ